MQAKLPDLTPYLTGFGFLLMILWRVWEEIGKAREKIKKGNKAEREERDEELHKSLLPVERRATEAEKLLALTEKHLALAEAEKLRLEAEVERLKHRLAERDETEDRLTTAHNNLLGRMDELERRLEGKNRDRR